MTTEQIYELAVKLGIKADLRGAEKVKKYLARAKKNYDELSAKAKEEFDQEKLTNPYSDTRILVDLKKKPIKKIMVGIDMEGAELLLADKLGVDLVIAHHPEGKALADLHSVMDLQAEVLAGYGVPINIAESVIKPRIADRHVLRMVCWTPSSEGLFRCPLFRLCRRHRLAQSGGS